MSQKQFQLRGSATLANIRKAVGEVKQAVKEGHLHKPVVIIYGNRVTSLFVGVRFNEDNSQPIDVTQATVLEFTTEHYKELAKKTENTHEMAKVIQENAQNKFKRSNQVQDYLAYDHFLYQVAECLGEGIGLNVIYNQGVASFDSFEYIDKDDMVVQVQLDLASGKRLKALQIKGYERASIDIKVEGGNQYLISCTYFGYKDNIYETFLYNPSESLHRCINQWLQSARTYDENLTRSRLDLDGGKTTSKRKKTLGKLTEEEYQAYLEDE